MAQNLQIDPTTRDYVVPAGSPIGSDRVLEACYYPLKIQQGRWLHAAVGQGSQLYKLQNVKRTASIEQEFAGYTQAAIESQVIGVGKATAVQIRNIEATRTGSSNQINVVPSNVQLSQQLAFVPV